MPSGKTTSGSGRGVIRQKLRGFFRLTRGERLLFAGAYGLLGVSRLVLRLVPFRHIARRLGPAGGGREAVEGQWAEARRIGRMVELAARHTPWRSACLAQALTAKWMLGWRGIPATLYFGVAWQEDRQLEAHAWVTCGPVHVTGGDGFERYQVVSAHGPAGRGGRGERGGPALPPEPEEGAQGVVEP